MLLSRQESNLDLTGFLLQHGLIILHQAPPLLVDGETLLALCATVHGDLGIPPTFMLHMARMTHPFAVNYGIRGQAGVHANLRRQLIPQSRAHKARMLATEPLEICLEI